MKVVAISLILIILLDNTAVLGQRRGVADSVDVTIKLNKPITGTSPIDSVLVFFDRYDLRGAGIIKKVFYPANGKIIIRQVPEGRYFIGVFCMGAYQQFLSEITFINKRRTNYLSFNLKRCEQYIPGMFVPVAEVDFNKLAITQPKLFR